MYENIIYDLLIAVAGNAIFWSFSRIIAKLVRPRKDED